MTDIYDFIFGPLEKSYYCNFFLVLTIFGFVFLIGAVIILCYNVFKKSTSRVFINSIMVVLFYGVFYLQSRILYSICLGTIG